MSMTSHVWITSGAALAGLAVVAGAFGAHGLDRYFAEKYATAAARSIGGLDVPASYKALDDFKTAARYQMYHALGLIAVGLVAAIRGPTKPLTIAAWLFVGGIVLFSGGLYLYTLTGQRFWGVGPPPIGGLLFIVGWIALAIGACPCTRHWA
ncbi:MAG TPA: DUF423 domain-containing protein [Planctomycetaceae bacterium]|nr:DUF423 domain-containing protein [Planctomycetaceae bacterium]